MNATATGRSAARAAELGDDDIAALQALLDGLPPPLEPLDISALDGFLCALVLQPRPVPADAWLPWVLDLQARPVPAAAAPAAQAIGALAERRMAELERAISRRQWFDPWLFEPDGDDVAPVLAMQPWVIGFDAALQAFGGIDATGAPALTEPLAVLYAAFDPDDLDDAGDLLAVIETLEPPAQMAEAAEDIVRSALLIADVTRPRRPAPRSDGARAAPRPRGPRRS